MNIQEIGIRTKRASHQLKSMPTDKKNAILARIHASLAAKRDFILAQNRIDLQDSSISKQLLKRLDLSQKFDDLLKGVLDVAKLKDPNSIL